MAENGENKVIRVNFGKARDTSQVVENTNTPLVQREIKNTQSDSNDESFFKSHAERSFNALKLLIEFDSFIRSLRGYAQKDSNVALRRQGLRDSTLETLIETIEKSSDNDWKQHPSYYRATFEELSERIKKLREATPPSYKEKLKGSIVSASDAIKEDYLFMLLHGDFVRNATQNVSTTITDFVFDRLPGFVYSAENLELRRQGLRGHRLEDLCAIINKSTEKDWKKSPHFYGAVILETNDRIEKVRAAE